MAKRKKREELKAERELTRKETRLREREREHNRRLYLGVGLAIGVALILILVGALYTFAYIPNSTLATIGSETIVTKDFWQRMRLEKSRLTGQLVNMQQLEQQFGQGIFGSQISQIQAQLASPFALGVQVLDDMIDEDVIEQEAVTRGITVSDEEVDVALREEIARNRNTVTEPQATETADASIQATATATLLPPTPTPTIDASLVVTATATTAPTAEPLPTRSILSDTGYTEGLNELADSLGTLNSVNLDGYRKIIRDRLLREKLVTAIADETVSPVEAQVHARHILINVMTPTVEIDSSGIITAPIGASDGLTATATLTGTDELTTAETLSATAPLTAAATVSATAEVTEAVASTTALTPTTTLTPTTALTPTTPLTATAAITGVESISGTTALTDSAALTGTASLTDSVDVPPAREQVERTDAEALALAEEIRQRLLAGEDFAKLAEEYSDDTGSGANGGDLGWFGPGAMVASFDAAAFSLPIGEISEPIKTQFGYHIIEVLEKDENRPKEQSKLDQERNEAFTNWLEQKKIEMDIQRPDDLNARLPRDLR